MTNPTLGVKTAAKKAVKITAKKAVKRTLSYTKLGISGETTPDIERNMETLVGGNSPDIEKGKRKTHTMITTMTPGGIDHGELQGEVRHRSPPQERYVPTDWDESLPYGGKVYLARKKKPETWPCLIFQTCVVLFAVGLMYYGLAHTQHMHFHVTKLYAKMGHKEAQATIGHKLLFGNGTEQNRTEAMMWFHEAAKQGHPQSSYNVAVGYLQGLKTQLKQGEARKLIEHAAAHGVKEAIYAVENLCTTGQCDL